MHSLGLNIPMFGLAKRIEEIILPDSDLSIVLDRHSNALHLIQRLRDEAHRFAITHHRSLRGKTSVSSRLDGVAGVGPARRKSILRHFKTVEALRAATVEEIAQVPGLPESVAQNVYAMLHQPERTSDYATASPEEAADAFLDAFTMDDGTTPDSEET